MTVRVNVNKGTMVPLDSVLPSRGMLGVSFLDVSELDPPIPERIALLRIAPLGEIVDGVGVRLDENIYIVQEC